MRCQVINDFLTAADIEVIKLEVSETINTVFNQLVAIESEEIKQQVRWSRAKIPTESYDQYDHSTLYTDHCEGQTVDFERLVSGHRMAKIRNKLKSVVEEYWDEIAFDGQFDDRNPEIGVVVYKEGERFRWHYDRRFELPINPSVEQRRVSFLIIVQNAEQGGRLELDEQEDFDLDPGTLVLFDPRIYYQVSQIKQGTQISLFGWSLKRRDN